MRSLRSRVAVVVLAASAVLTAAGAIGLRLVVARWLASNFDDQLAAKAHSLVSQSEQEDGVVELDYSAELMPEFSASANDPEYFQCWLDDGEELVRSDSLQRVDLDRSDGPPLEDPLGAPSFRNVELPDGRRGRSLQLDFVPPPEASDLDELGSGASFAVPEGIRTATLVVARERETLDRQIALLERSLGLFAATLLVGLAVAVPVAVRLGLRPLGELASEVERLDESTLGHHLRAPGTIAELAPLVERLNQLLTRLDEAFHRERRFSGDVAHELRTPVAELRSLAEVGERWPGDEASARAFFADVRDLAAHMERLVEDLLALARRERDEDRPPQRQPVLVESVVARCWKHISQRAAERNIALSTSFEPGLQVQSDEEILERIVGNLLANAVSYSPPESVVSCHARHRGDATVLFVVANPTDDLEPADLPHLFERFWRKDPARSGGRSLGLGLPLVQAFCELLDIAISLDLEAGQFRVTLVFAGAT